MIRRRKLEKNYIEVPNTLAQDEVEKGGNLSGNAFMILVNIMSYPETWEIYKTEIHTRYEKIKRSAVDSAWKELVEAGYIFPCRYRDGKKYKYIYYMQLTPIADHEKKEIMQELLEEFGENLDCGFSTVDFQQSKMNSRKPTPNKETGNKETDNKQTDNKENPNPNHKESENDIYNVLWELDIPQTLKIKIKNKIVDKRIHLSIEQLEQIEDAYHYQISKGFIDPECAHDDIEALNDRDFTKTIIKMLMKVENIENMRGLIKEWVEQAYSYKRNQFYVSDFSGGSGNSIFYDWLNN